MGRVEAGKETTTTAPVAQKSTTEQSELVNIQPEPPKQPRVQSSYTRVDPAEHK